MVSLKNFWFSIVEKKKSTVSDGDASEGAEALNL